MSTSEGLIARAELKSVGAETAEATLTGRWPQKADPHPRSIDQQVSLQPGQTEVVELYEEADRQFLKTLGPDGFRCEVDLTVESA